MGVCLCPEGRQCLGGCPSGEGGTGPTWREPAGGGGPTRREERGQCCRRGALPGEGVAGPARGRGGGCRRRYLPASGEPVQPASRGGRQPGEPPRSAPPPRFQPGGVSSLRAPWLSVETVHFFFFLRLNPSFPAHSSCTGTATAKLDKIIKKKKKRCAMGVASLLLKAKGCFVHKLNQNAKKIPDFQRNLLALALVRCSLPSPSLQRREG